ncbi:MAG TPA: AbrB/MazE/SpoVT family DNA-binding domain-containing protein [Chloroflexota bacterium]|nr:AbrB/MazE/SpoVT family DNA-binding domain-containing protein [Chloroflexota bacterium]
MALAKVLARGQITIPREIRERVSLAPGNLVRIEPVGVGKFLVEVIPTLTLDEILERYHSDQTVDLPRLLVEGEAQAAEEIIRKVSEQANQGE